MQVFSDIHAVQISEETIAQTYMAGNIERAKQLADAAIARGAHWEWAYHAISEWELRFGDPARGFGICVSTAEQAKSVNAGIRLTHWLCQIATNKLTRNGSRISLEINSADASKILGLILDITRGEAFQSAPLDAVWRLPNELGFIGYWYDEVVVPDFGDFARTYLEATPYTAAEIADAALKRTENAPHNRFLAYFMAAGGEVDTADHIMTRISTVDGARQAEEADGGWMANEIDIANQYESPQIERTSKRLCRLTENRANLGRVLDVGCGTGLTARQIADRATFIHGLEPDAGRIKLAESSGIYDALTCTLLDGFPSDAGPFDTIVSSAVLCLIPDLNGVLSQMRRLIGPDGSIYVDILTCAGDDAIRSLGQYSLWSDSTIAREAAAAGLRIEQMVKGASQFSVGAYVEFKAV